jgi:four helix bundle protein
MAGFRDFQEIAAWRLARSVKIKVDHILERPEVMRRFKFRDQLSDAARSAPRNIAEGFGRFKHREFAQFVRIAKGSEVEVLNHLIDACDQRLLTREEFLLLEHDIKRALKAANGLIRYLESTPDVPLPPYKPKRPKDSGPGPDGV